MIRSWNIYFATLTPFSKVLVAGCSGLALLWLLSLVGLGNQLPFNNPRIDCPATAHTNPDDRVYEDTTQRAFTDLQQFCTRMRTTFHQSALTRSEALATQAIFQALRDTDWTLASPEAQKLHFVNDYQPVAAGMFDDRRFQIPQRVMLKKDGPETYEIFYYVVECGVTYHYQQVTIVHNRISDVKTRATWATSSSC